MEAPLVHPSGQPDFVNPQLDKGITGPKEKEELRKTMTSFFDELDRNAASEPTPEPPTEKPAEKKGSPQTTDEVVAPEPEVAYPVETAKEETPEPAPAPVATSPAPVTPATAVSDLDSLELHPSAGAEQKSQFSKLKEIAKKFSEKAKAYEKFAPVLRDLGYTFEDTPEDIAKTIEDFGPKVRTWKNGAMSPEISTELENLRSLARAIDYKHSPEYKEQYANPLNEAYLDVLTEASRYFDAPPEKIAEFMETMKTKFTPADVDSKWWSDTCIASMKKADGAVKQKVLSKVADLLKLQEKHDKAVQQIAGSGDSYQKWQQQRNEQFSRDYDFQVRNEVEQAFETEKSHLKPWLPIPTQGVSDPDKLAEIKAHNERFAGLERRFSDILVGVNAGPRKAARYALDFIEMQEQIPAFKKELETANSQIKALEAENAKLKTEVTAKRKVADAPLRTGVGNTSKPLPEKKKLTEAAGMKGLRAAFEKDLPST